MRIFLIVIIAGLATLAGPAILAGPACAQPTRHIFDGSEYRMSVPSEITHFGPDGIEGTADDETRLIINLKSDRSFGTADEYVRLADDVFEQFGPMHSVGATVAKVRLTHEEGPEWDAPMTQNVVEYRLVSGIWQRITRPDIPVLRSVGLPFEPANPIRLSSGETIQLLPITRGLIPAGLMWREERETVYLRVVVDRHFQELADNDPIIHLVWREVLHDILAEGGDNYVSVIIYTDFPSSRFDFMDALRVNMPSRDDGSWPDLGFVVGQFDNIERYGIKITQWR